MDEVKVIAAWERATLHLKSISIWERLGLAEQYDKEHSHPIVLATLEAADNPFRNMRGNYVRADEPIVPVKKHF